MSAEDNPTMEIPEVNELDNLKSARDRAREAGQDDVVEALTQKIDNFNGSTIDEEKSENKKQPEQAPAFIGIDKEGDEEDQKRYDELMGLANELFVEEKDEDGEIIGIVINEEADQEDIFNRFDEWYDKYKDDFPEPTGDVAEVKHIIKRFMELVALLTKFQDIDLGTSDEASDLKAEIANLLNKGLKGITNSDIARADSILNRATRQLSKRAA